MKLQYEEIELVIIQNSLAVLEHRQLDEHSRQKDQDLCMI